MSKCTTFLHSHSTSQRDTAYTHIMGSVSTTLQPSLTAPTHTAAHYLVSTNCGLEDVTVAEIEHTLTEKRVTECAGVVVGVFQGVRGAVGVVVNECDTHTERDIANVLKNLRSALHATRLTSIVGLPQVGMHTCISCVCGA